MHRLELIHAFGRRRGLAWFFNAPSIRVGGNTDTVLATSRCRAQPFETRLSAPSWRQVIDVGNWDASGGIHLPGQSGQPGSRHYRDLSRRWKTNRQFPLYWSAPGGPSPRAARLVLCPLPAAHATEPGGTNIGVVTRSDQRGIVRGCCLGLLVLLILVGGSVFLADRALAAPVLGAPPAGPSHGATETAIAIALGKEMARELLVAPHGVVVLSEQDLTVLAVANNPHPNEYREPPGARAQRARGRVGADLGRPLHTDGGGAHQPIAAAGTERPGDRRAGSGGRHRHAGPSRVCRFRDRRADRLGALAGSAVRDRTRGSPRSAPISSASRSFRAGSRSACTYRSSPPNHRPARDLGAALRGDDRERRTRRGSAPAGSCRAGCGRRVGDLTEKIERSRWSTRPHRATGSHLARRPRAHLPARRSGKTNGAQGSASVSACPSWRSTRPPRSSRSAIRSSVGAIRESKRSRPPSSASWASAASAPPPSRRSSSRTTGARRSQPSPRRRPGATRLRHPRRAAIDERRGALRPLSAVTRECV